MEPHQERVINEKKELDEKLLKLKEFCFGNNNSTFKSLDPIDRDLLEDQYSIMQKYSIILGKRIQRFK